MIEAESRLSRCLDCGVRLEAVPWAWPGAQHTRDFEHVVAWLAQQMVQVADHLAAQGLPGQDTVKPIIERVVADRIDHARLDEFVLEVRWGERASMPG